MPQWQLSFAKVLKIILLEREKTCDVPYKGVVLPHKFYADFVVFDQVILEIKAKDGIVPEEEDMAQTLNYRH